MIQKTYLPLQQLVAELKTLCRAQHTGIFRITTDTNHTAQFALEAGRVVALRYRIKRGLEALELIKAVQAGHYSFEEGKSAGNEEAALPSNEEIFGQLEAVAPAVAKTPVTVVNPTSAPARESSYEFSTATKAVLEAALTEHIGPMAGIVCRNVFSRATSLDDALTMLKERVPDPARAEQFERDVTQKMRA